MVRVEAESSQEVVVAAVTAQLHLGTEVARS